MIKLYAHVLQDIVLTDDTLKSNIAFAEKQLSNK